MSKYSINKNKIEKIWNDTLSTHDEVVKQQKENAIILQREEKLNQAQTQIKSIVDTTSNWITISPFITVPSSGITEAGYSWQFSLTGLQEEFLNAFSFDFAWRFGEGDIRDEVSVLRSSTLIGKRVIFQRIQSLVNPDFFDLNIDASINFEDVLPGGLQTNIQVQLIAIESSPYLFTNG